MRTIIAGSREGAHMRHLEKAVAECGWEISLVLSGCARGADSLGEEWARRNKIPVERYPADWDRHGKVAGIIRNGEMCENAEALIALWDGQSHGTQHCIKRARELGLRVHIQPLTP